MAVRAELLRPGFKGLGTISAELEAGFGAGTGVAVRDAACALTLTLVLPLLLAAGWTGAFAAGFSDVFVNAFVTDLVGLGTALVCVGTGLVTAFLLGGDMAFFVGAVVLTVGLAFALGTTTPAGLTAFFTALTGAFGVACLAFVAGLTAPRVVSLADVLVFLASAFTMCLLGEAAAGEPSSPCCDWPAEPGPVGPARSAGRFPGLSVACQFLAATISRLLLCPFSGCPADSIFRIFGLARDCSGSPACGAAQKPNRWRIDTNMLPSCLIQPKARSLTQTRHCSRPCIKISLGRSMPIKTILLFFFSP